eukprot:1834717-Prymnesium_polylepis.1
MHAHMLLPGLRARLQTCFRPRNFPRASSRYDSDPRRCGAARAASCAAVRSTSASLTASAL